MRSVFSRGSRKAAAWLLIVVLLAPAAYASDTTGEVSLWTEFLLWLQAGIGVPEDAEADDVSFSVWLMGRIHIPGG
jgi:hypothetical protein